MTGSADERSRQEVAVLREMVEVYSKLSGLASQGSHLGLRDKARMARDARGTA